MTTVIEKVLQLQDIEIFRFAYTEHLAHLASVCKELEKEEGDSLFQKGDDCSCLYLLVEGQVELELETGRVVSVQNCALDQWSFLARRPHRYSARCADSCLLYTVSYEDMVDLLTSEPEFSWSLTRHLSEIARNAGDYAASKE
jgi:CRP-like cAMP-binding protein